MPVAPKHRERKMQRAPFDPDTLDPGMAQFLQNLAAAGEVDFAATPIADLRALFTQLCSQFEAPAPQISGVENHIIAGPNGDIAIRQYIPTTARDMGGALVFYHGGGWTLGNLDSHDILCRRLAQHSGICVFSVEYRLAPEHPFPAGLDDALAGFCWVRDHSEQLNIHAGKIAVGGDSAGGNLAAVLANELSPGGNGPAFQMLLYPAMDVTGTAPMQNELAEGYFLTAKTMEFFAQQYVPAKMDAAHPRISPALAMDLSKTAPALILTAGFDPLCDTAMHYADKLRAAGIVVDEIHAPAMIHGFFNFTALSPVALELVQDVGKRLGEVFQN